MAVRITMKRNETSTPWGFRMNGGTEFNLPIYIQRVNSHSLSARAGLQPGDGLLMIGQSPTEGMSHQQAKMEIIRAGNELDFVVQRNTVPVGAPELGEFAPHYAQDSHTSAYPASAHRHGPAQNPDVQSRSFKVLQQQLAE